MSTDYETRNAVEIEPGIFDCEILHPTKGWLPHTCSADDTDPAGKARHEMLVGTNSFRQMTSEERAARNEMKRDLAASYIRSARTDRLAAVDYITAPDVWPALTPEKQAEWVTYRHNLRDVPEQVGFPETVTWPVRPE
tara:strand:- start:722 stop:1135 length:414 start_codon:yes stop_codon:yes gene_type:complete